MLAPRLALALGFPVLSSLAALALGCSGADATASSTTSDGGVTNPGTSTDGGGVGPACTAEGSRVIGSAPAAGDAVLIGVAGDSKGPVVLVREGEELVVRRTSGERVVIAKVSTSSYAFAASIAARPDGTACVAYATPTSGLAYACGPDFVAKDSGLAKVTDGKSVALAETKTASVAFVYGHYASVDAFVREVPGDKWVAEDPQISSISIPWSAATLSDLPYACISFGSQIGIVGPRLGAGSLDDLAYGDVKTTSDGPCTIASDGKQLVIAYTADSGEAVVGTYDPAKGERTFKTSALGKDHGRPLLVAAPSGAVDILFRDNAGAVLRSKQAGTAWSAPAPMNDLPASLSGLAAWVDATGAEHIFAMKAKDVVYARSCR
jgi:hypothetical protein